MLQENGIIGSVTNEKIVMNFTLRKVERRTIWEATEAVNLNPENFSKLRGFPYTGDVKNELEFLQYLHDLYWEEMDWYETLYELERLGMDDDAEALGLLFGGEMSVYSDTSENGEDSWLEIGEVDKAYRKYGGFNSRHNTM